jgi:hypothetical protein
MIIKGSGFGSGSIPRVTSKSGSGRPKNMWIRWIRIRIRIRNTAFFQVSESSCSTCSHSACHHPGLPISNSAGLPAVQHPIFLLALKYSVYRFHILPSFLLFSILFFFYLPTFGSFASVCPFCLPFKQYLAYEYIPFRIQERPQVSLLLLYSACHSV